MGPRVEDLEYELNLNLIRGATPGCEIRPLGPSLAVMLRLLILWGKNRPASSRFQFSPGLPPLRSILASHARIKNTPCCSDVYSYKHTHDF